jgi:plastocyanin
MRAHGFIVGLAAALVAGVAACSSSTAPSPNGGTGGGTSGTSSNTITASSTTTGGGAYGSGSGGNYFFSPTPDTVAAGTSVTYMFGSVAHNVHFSAVAGAPDSIQTSSNTSVSRTFPTAGTYNYMCTIHHFSGIVVVH